jgi:hypothetical protein
MKQQASDDRCEGCLHKTVLSLLESLAAEESALAGIVRAETERIQAMTRVSDSESESGEPMLVPGGEGASRLLDTMLMNEWLLLRKLEQVLEIWSG